MFFCRRVSGLVSFFCVFFLILAASAQAQQQVATSREFKMLLKMTRFTDLHAGIADFWQLLEEAGRRSGIKLVKSSGFPGTENTRFVAFYDTPKLELYRKGFTLRRRSETITGVQPGTTGQSFDLTLKFRHTELMLGVVPTVQPAPSCKSKSKIEEDIVVGTKSCRKVYSISSKVKLKKEPGLRLRDHLSIFPGLPRLNINLDAHVLPVRQTYIREQLYAPGNLALIGEVTAPVTFSFWRKTSQKRPFLAECSFAYQALHNGKPDSALNRADSAANRFVKALQVLAKDWIDVGQTKTGAIYQVSVENAE